MLGVAIGGVEPRLGAEERWVGEDSKLCRGISVLLAFLHFNFQGGGGSWLRIRPLGRWLLESCK